MNLLTTASLLFGLFLIGSANQLTSTKYVITAPKVISPKDSKICLVPVQGRFDEATGPREVLVSLLEANTGKILTQQRQELQAEDPTCVELSLTPIRQFVAQLHVEVPGVLTEQRIVRVSPVSVGMTLVETSKPVYKPGDELVFRVINFDGQMQLYETQLAKITIYNPYNYKVMEWRDVTVHHGMLVLEHSLARPNVEGVWKIVITTLDNQIVEKTFEVNGKEPEVYIDLQSEPYLYANHDSQRVVLCAKDKYGHPLSGHFQLLAYFLNPSQSQPLSGDVEEDGCKHFVLSNSRLGWAQNIGAVYTLQVTFSTENPNHLVSIKKRFPVVRSPIFLRKLSNKLVHNYFKPGLPYFGYLVASKASYDPVASQEVHVCYEARRQPWIKAAPLTCANVVSDVNGAVKFVVPPVDEATQQIYIEASFTGVADHKQIFTINPWVSRSESHIVIEPKVMEECQNDEESHKFYVLASKNLGDHDTVWWQRNTGSATNGGIHKKQFTPREMSRFLVAEPTQVWSNIIGSWPSSAQVYRINFTVEDETDPDWRLERVVIFASDLKGNLMMDSISWIRNCAQRESPFEIESSSNRLRMAHKMERNFPCTISIDSEDKRGKLTEKKIAKLLEQYDSINDPYVLDKCAQQEKRRRSELQAPVNYHNDWDAFTHGGLIPVSNYELYDKPCGWEAIDEKLFNQTYEAFMESKPFMPAEEEVLTALEQQAEWSRMMSEEASLKDPFEWDIIEKESDFRAINERLERRPIDTKVYHLSSICNSPRGLRISHIKKQLDAPFILRTDIPEVVPSHVRFPFSFFLERTENDVHVSRCIPVQINSEPSLYVQLQPYPKSFCACGKVTKVNGIMFTRGQGIANLKVQVEWASDLQGCAFNEEAHFSSFPVNFDFRISSNSSASVKQQIDFVYEKEQRSIDVQEGNQVAVANDLISILLNKTQAGLSYNKNVLDVLSKFWPLVQQYNQTKDEFPEYVKKWVLNTIAQSYQELFYYRLQDGSYSLQIGSQKQSNYPVTVVVYAALSQAREANLWMVDDAQLTETYQWMASKIDGQGYVRVPSEYYTNWPFQHNGEVSKEEMTAFTVAILYQTHHHHFVTRKTEKAIPDTVQNDSDDLTNAMIASIWAQKGDFKRAQKFLSTINLDGIKRLLTSRLIKTTEMFQSQSESLQDHYPVVAFYILASVNFPEIPKDKVFRTLVRELAINSNAQYDPLATYTLAKAWSVFGSQKSVPELKMNGKRVKLNEQTSINASFPHLTGNTIEVRSGVALFLKNTVENQRPNGANDERVKVSNLETGYKNCGTRMIRICNEDSEKLEAPIYIVRVPSGFRFDESTMRKMAQAGQLRGVDLWARQQDDVMVIPSRSEKCVSIPLVQITSIAEARKGVVQFHDARNVSAEVSYVSYEIPLNCEVRNYFKTPVFAESAPCPEAQEESCPFCMTWSHRKCDADSFAIGLPLRTSRSHSNWSSRNSTERNQGCYKFQLNLKMNGDDDEERTQTVYLRKECQCAPPSLEGYVLIGRSNELKENYQINSKDAVVFAASIQDKTCSKSRSKREILGISSQTAAANARNQKARSTTASNTATNKNERSYEQQQQAEEYPAKGYPAPPPPPVYEPAYNPPSPVYEPAYNPPPPPPAKGYPAPPPPQAYEPAYNPPPPVYEPAYAPPAYQAPAYEPAYPSPPVKGYSPPPVYEPAPYSPPAYSPPAYSPPAYSPPAYAPPPPVYEQAPAYNPPPPAKGYPAPPPVYEPAPYSPPAYQAPVYEPAYAPPPPVYEQAYAPPPVYEQAPAYAPPPPVYEPAPYMPPAYAPPAYSPPAYQAPAYEPAYVPPPPVYEPAPYAPPAKGYPAPAYAPPPPAYEPAYAPPPPVYEPAYAPPPPVYEPAYAPPPPVYEPAYAPPPPVYEPAYAPPAKGYQAPVYRQSQGRQGSRAQQGRFANRLSQGRKPQYSPQANFLSARQQYAAAHVARAYGMKAVNKYQGQSSERIETFARPLEQQRCSLLDYEESCPQCFETVSLEAMDKLCSSNVYVVDVHENLQQLSTESQSYRCGNYTVQGAQSEESVPFTMNRKCNCQAISSQSPTMLITGTLNQGSQTGHKFSRDTIVVKGTQHNIQQINEMLGVC